MNGLEASEPEELLWTLLRCQARRYTGGQSTSLREETAQTLLRSIRFSLALPGVLRQDITTPEALLYAGERAVRAQVKRAHFLYLRARRCVYQEECLSLETTLSEIGGFFRAYDPVFFAAELPCGIDYQLSLPVPEQLMGVLWLGEYIRRLLTEDAILRRLPPEGVRRVLGSIPEHREVLMNLYIPVAEAALGVTLIEGDLFSLNMTEAEQRRAQVLLSGRTRAERAALLRAAAQRLSRRLALSDREEACLLHTAEALLPRVEAVLDAEGGWQGIFPAF